MDYSISKGDEAIYAFLSVFAILGTMLIGFLCSLCIDTSDPDPMNIIEGYFERKQYHKEQDQKRQ